MILAYVYGLMGFSMLSTLYILGYGLNGVGSNHVLTFMCKNIVLTNIIQKYNQELTLEMVENIFLRLLEFFLYLAFEILLLNFLCHPVQK